MPPLNVPLSTQKKRLNWRWLLPALLVVAAVGGYAVYRFTFTPSQRFFRLAAFRTDPQLLEQYMLHPGMRCGDAPFAFPTTGVIFGLWDQSYRLGHRHQGLDIFPGTDLGVTPVYASYPGYLTRLSDWRSSVIIRIPQDPLQPERQIWTYYTHMADQQGNSYISEQFPPGTSEVFVEAGTFLGYAGNYSGDPVNPTGLHLHISVVKDNDGAFLNELDIENTYDPSPYFNLPVNNNLNPGDFPTCMDTVSYQNWEALKSDE